MFDFDNWTEIFASIKKNKLRTFLTGFSISWSIFMFIILLASSNGAMNGVMTTFGSRDVNSISIFGRTTSIPFKGLPDNRKIELDEKDFELINNQILQKEFISPCINTIATASYKKDYAASVTLVGVYPEYTHINGIKIKDKQGRFISDFDIDKQRKVAVINQRLKDVLYQDKNPVGEDININNLRFTVIGVFDETSSTNIEKAYIPFSTSQLLFYGGWGFTSLAFTVKNLDTKKSNEQFIKDLRTRLGALHQFDPEDEQAVTFTDRLDTYLQTLGIFNAVNVFIWVIGIGTLFAGIVGISNIMLITVRERTREFGIRKALGAKPYSILINIVVESVVITSMFGYLGLFVGMGLSKLFDWFLDNNTQLSSLAIFENPSVNVTTAIGAMIVLVIAGVLAGYFPARLAVKVPAVEAMRAE
ncbi:putative ABC transport system permease protein [Parabacteroides sp. PF5-5]|uniref:ABC transporter permease n=1 Tax=unclassified Parabacteroides TaxID=2649774 RepID=UPI0024768559|nr:MULTISPECIES: ABC transporter permease [unclassified Parabacteroides]MDH6306515.1 putative ABC transport system permease protein [Parabacteroides sp. PH5-39]MDH6317482.1 putative ABC transport system permease protein [Parabacteroides sp. PF5-13]MDH6321215.1 putative ABC transport system permease protein [Parabacteroides sp. PH5-13]MDH6324947.1 putative ABC transport system permease protein [Parabacteroides sp. PH5-8]MDH6328656.1 putative ABC transport system permease protein [Parabacteroide